MFTNDERKRKATDFSARLRGVVVPLASPLLEDESPDIQGLSRLVDHVITGGGDAIFSLGTTGEFARFDGSTRARIASATVRAAAGRVPVLVGASDTGTRLVIEHIEDAATAGADATVVSLPYYFPVKDEGEVLSFYQAVAAASPLPIVLYNIPATCGADIGVETFRKLLELDGIVGFKDSSGSMDYLRAIMAVAGPDFPVFVGEERLCAEGLEAGAAGLVPSLANVFPRVFAELYAAGGRKDFARARELQKDIAAMNSFNLYSGSWLSAVAWRKTALSLMGICGETMTEPYVPVDAATRASIASLVARNGYSLRV